MSHFPIFGLCIRSLVRNQNDENTTNGQRAGYNNFTDSEANRERHRVGWGGGNVHSQRIYSETLDCNNVLLTV
jgi:hypothetical protein